MRKGNENVMEHGNGIIEIGEQSYTSRRLEIQARDRGDTGKRQEIQIREQRYRQGGRGDTVHRWEKAHLKEPGLIATMRT